MLVQIGYFVGVFILMSIESTITGNRLAPVGAFGPEGVSKKLAYRWRGAELIVMIAFTLVFWRFLHPSLVIGLIGSAVLIYGPLASVATIHRGNQMGYFAMILSSRPH